ncbi:MAG: TIM-barrel domain-containing protein [Armatimonadota bacterium]
MIGHIGARIGLLGAVLAASASGVRAQAQAGAPLGAVQSWEAKREGVYFRVALGDEQATALVSALSSKVIRIQVARDEAQIGTAGRREGMAAREEDGGVLLTVSQLVLHVDTDPFGIAIGARDGDVIFDSSAEAGGGFRLDAPMGRRRQRGAEVSYATTQTEHFYGLGAKFNSLDQRGKRAEIWIRAPFKAISDESYICAPFFVSSRGYGVWLDTHAWAAFDFRRSREGQAQLQVAAPKLDLYFIMGPALADVIRRYSDSDLTGRSPLPPRWAFLPWVSAGSYGSQEDVLAVADRMRAENIPCSVIVIENWRGDPFYEFDAGQFPDPEAMLKELRQNDFHCLLGMVPFIHPTDPLAREAANQGYFPRDAEGRLATLRGPFGTAQQFRGWTLVDFSNPDAAAWWGDLHRPLLKMGVEGFKTHGAEAIPTGMTFADALASAEMHNLYPSLYNGAVYDLVRRETEGRGIIWAGAGAAGIQRYPAISAGWREANWDNLRATIRAGLSAGMSGIPFWGHDIGGYWPAPTKELYIRWAQLGAFSPIMQLHGRNAREPWRFDDQTVRIYRKYATVRANLLPYIYSIARQAAETGMPLMRPLALAYPGDEQAAAIDDEYLFGPSLLVAPVCDAGAESREVYLPEGEWIDFWENTIYAGPGRLSRSAPLDTIPVFVRADGVVPMELVRGRSPGDELRAEPELTLDVYPFAKGEFGLLDRGTNTRVVTERNGATLSLHVEHRKRRCVLRILCGEPKNVEVSGTQFPPITSRRTWSYNNRTQRLLVRVASHQRVAVTVTGARLPVLFANIDHPRTVCSAEPQMTVEADVLNLGDEAQPMMQWTDNTGAEGQVPGARIPDRKDGWRFLAPLPGPTASPGYMRFWLVGGAEPTTGPVTGTRQTTLTPPVDVRLDVAGSRTVGPSPVPVEVTISNNSRRTATGTVRLSATGSKTIEPADTQQYTAPALGGEKRVRFDVTFPEDLRVGEHRVTAQVQWQELDMRLATTTVTKQPTWAIIGPFDNPRGQGLSRRYEPDTLNINAAVRGKGKRWVRWQRYPSERLARDGMLDFRAAYPAESWALAYATAWVDSPVARQVEVRVGSDSPLIVRVNGEDVLRTRQQNRAAQPDQDVARARLKRGRNVILVKSAGWLAKAKWRMYFRMVGVDDAGLADLVDLGATWFQQLPEAKLTD